MKNWSVSWDNLEKMLPFWRKYLHVNKDFEDKMYCDFLREQELTKYGDTNVLLYH